MKNTWKRFPQIALFIYVAIYAAISTSWSSELRRVSPAEDISMECTNDLTSCGQKLRQAIDAKYEELDRTGQLKMMGRGTNDIHKMIQRFIPLGSTFENAEKILIAAGFRIAERGANPMYPKSVRLLARLDNYGAFAIGSARILVALVPPSDKDWSRIVTIEAGIVLITI